MNEGAKEVRLRVTLGNNYNYHRKLKFTASNLFWWVFLINIRGNTNPGSFQFLPCFLHPRQPKTWFVSVFTLFFTSPAIQILVRFSLYIVFYIPCNPNPGSFQLLHCFLHPLQPKSLFVSVFTLFFTSLATQILVRFNFYIVFYIPGNPNHGSFQFSHCFPRLSTNFTIFSFWNLGSSPLW